MKWATKLAMAREAKGKRTEQKKKRNRLAKKVQIFAYAHARKTKELLNYFQLAENHVLSVGNILFSPSHGRKTVQRGGFSPKFVFSQKIGWQQRVNMSPY